MDKEKNTLSGRLVYRNVKFARMHFEFKKTMFNEDTRGTFRDNLDMQINWLSTATKKDNKGVIISSDLKLNSTNLVIHILVQTKMEFDKELPKELIFNSTYLQVLAANLFFPYLTEAISSNSGKMGITPIIIGYDILDKIIEETEKQGGFEKKPPTKQR